MIMIIASAILLASFALSIILTIIARKAAIHHRFVSRPAKDRYSQSVVALGGGVAIFWTIALILLSASLIVKFLIAPGHMDWLGENITINAEGFLDNTNSLFIVIIAAFALHLTGLWDDKYHLGAIKKLFLQFVITTCAAVFGGIRVELFIHNEFITTALSILWMVGIINAFNFLDNMDGLSAGIAAIATSVLFTAAALSGQLFVGALALTLIGALLGFLVFNFPPAKIYMGDSGSLVVGFFVALITLRTTYYQQSISGGVYAVFMPLIVMAVPLYDFTSVTVIRILQGKSPFVGDTQHFSHRIKRRGLTDTQTALTLYLATLCTGVSAIFLLQVNLIGAILVFAQTLMILAIIAIMEMTGKSK